MCSRIGDTVGSLKVLGQIGTLGVVVKGELEYFHARIAGVFQQLAHFRRHKAQVFGDDGQIAQRCLDRIEQRHARTLSPLADLCGLVAVGDGIIAFESTEMVDAHGVVQRGCALQAVDPPGKAGLLVICPVIQRIAPQLTGGRKDIRRTAGNVDGLSLFVQEEKLRICPDIHTVICHINGNISHNGNAVQIAVGLEFAPLLVEPVLQHAVEVDLVGIGLLRLSQCFRITLRQFRFPLMPGLSLMGIFQRHKQGVFRQPCLLCLAEGQIARIVLPETAVCGPEYVETVVIHSGVVDPAGIIAPVNIRIVRRRKIALFLQALEVDKVGVSGVDGEGLVRRIAVAGRRKRQDLPHLGTAVPQEVGKHISRIAQLADAELRRQTGNVHQNTTFSHCDTSSDSYSIVFSVAGDAALYIFWFSAQTTDSIKTKR